jgi:hypothetical protein
VLILPGVPHLLKTHAFCILRTSAVHLDDTTFTTIIIVKGIPSMAIFYVLPSRQLLGQRFSALLNTLFPGTECRQGDWPELAETLGDIVEKQNAGYIIYREDLDEELGVKETLRRHFGAEEDDEIIEIQYGAACGLAHETR